MITDDDKEHIRHATDIVSLVSETVVLKPRGGNDFWGCCPFHHEKSPSFHVTPSTGLWHCFGCGAGGDVFDYVMKRESLDFLDAVRYLADRAHIDIDDSMTQGGHRGPKRTRLFDALEAAQDAFSVRLMRGKGQGAQEARAYLARRGLNSQVCAKWHLGYADSALHLPDMLRQQGFSQEELVAADLATVRGSRLRDHFYNRVMFPIHDERGRCIGFGGRVMDDSKPKYLNTRETSVFHKSHHMFAFDYAKDSITAEGIAIITEGYMDVIAMHEAGFTNTVAALGTALSADHIKTLSRFAHQIICMFDGDAAGQHAAEAAVQYLEKTQASLTCVVLPDNKDPDEFLKTESVQAMRAQLDAAQPLLDFVLNKRLATLDVSSPGQRLAALDNLAALLAPFKDSYLLDSYAQRLTVPLGMTLDAVKEKIRSTPVTPPDVYAPSSSSARAGSSPSSRGTSPVAPSYDDEPPSYYDEDEPYDDARYSTSSEPSPALSRTAPLRALSPEERTQLKAEQNLLTMLAQYCDAFRPYADRIASFSWADSRHETIAWAMLATPEHTSSADVVLAATRACPDAPRILGSGSFAFTSAWDTEKNVEFVVNEAEIRSLDRKIAQLTARLAQPDQEEESLNILRSLSNLRKRRQELRASQPLE